MVTVDPPIAEPTPFPPSAGPTRGPQRRRRRLLVVAFAGVSAVAIVVGLVLWLRGPDHSPKQITQDLPSGLHYVGGIDFHQAFHHEFFKRYLDSSIGATLLKEFKTRYGIDLKRLDAAAGGSMVIDGQLHVIIVVRGEFVEATLNPLLSAGSTGQVDVAGQLFYKTAAADFFAPRGVERPIETTDGDAATELEDLPKDPEAPVPANMKVANIVMGMTDEKTFIVGSQDLVERYLSGGATVKDDAMTAALLDRVNDDVVFFAVGEIKDVIGLAMTWGMPVVALLPLAGAVEGTTYVLQVEMRDEFVIHWEITLNREELVAQLKTLADNLPAPIASVSALAALAGWNIPEPEVEYDGRVIRGKMTVPFPNLPGL